MFGKQYLLTKQLVTAAALILGVSGVALADDSGMNPLTGDSSQNRGNLNMLAQSPCESKSLPAKRGMPITSPTYFNQYPGQ